MEKQFLLLTKQKVKQEISDNRNKSHLIVGFNLPDENRKVLDAQCGVIVHFFVGPLHRGLRISVGKNSKPS